VSTDPASPVGTDLREVEARFLDAYVSAYGDSPAIRHSSLKTRRRLAQKPTEVHAALDLGIALSVLESDEGASYFNVALLLADVGRIDAALLAFLAAIRLFSVTDPDRELAFDRAREIAEALGYKNVSSALSSIDRSMVGDEL